MISYQLPWVGFSHQVFLLFFKLCEGQKRAPLGRQNSVEGELLKGHLDPIPEGYDGSAGLWHGGEAGLGGRRPEFETGDFPRILSGFWFHPLLNRGHHILLACFFMFLVYNILTSEPLQMLFLLPGVPFPDLCSVPHHGHKSASRKVFLDHVAEVALYS